MDIILIIFNFLIPTLIIVILFNYVTIKQEKLEPHVKPNKQRLTDIYTDIKLEPYGCFTNLKQKFFLKKINPYTKFNEYDSGIWISENDSMIKLIENVIVNGFDEYGYNIIKKYPQKELTLLEIATLGKLSGYNYISVFKLFEKSKGNYYLTYSPPMNVELGIEYTEEQYKSALTKSDLPNYTLKPRFNKYTNEDEKSPGKELSCGYPCIANDLPQLDKDSSGNVTQYMCGSTAFPDIKTPSRFSVYKIVEIKK